MQLKDYEMAYKYWELNPKFLNSQEERRMYFVQSLKQIGSDFDTQVHEEHSRFVSNVGWDKYVTLRNSAYVVRPSPLYNDFYTCNCLKGMKNQTCKHAIAMMCKDKLYDYPEEITDAPLGQKRKRGRKRRASHALVID